MSKIKEIKSKIKYENYKTEIDDGLLHNSYLFDSRIKTCYGTNFNVLILEEFDFNKKADDKDKLLSIKYICFYGLRSLDYKSFNEF